MKRGHFITIEGIEGVGKSTQIARLAAALHERGIEHVVTREPGGTPLAESIRALVLMRQPEPLPACAELLLMFVARAVHLANLIEPNLTAGRWVLCDRFTDATYAYQGGGRGVEVDYIRQLESMVQGAVRPELTFLLDAPVNVALSQAGKRNAAAAATAADRFESERAEFFVRVREAYLARARAEPQRMPIIDATRLPEQVCAGMIAILEDRKWII